MLVEAGRRGLAHIELLQVESVLPFPYVIFGYNVGAAFQRKVAGHPAIICSFFKPVFYDLRIAFASSPDVEVVVHAGVSGICAGNQRGCSIPLFLAHAGSQMKGADI